MYFVGDELEKIKIIDRAFTALSLDDVKTIFGSGVIVDKLKGTVERDGPLMQAAKELQTTAADISFLRGDVSMLKSDIQTLIRCLNKPMGDVTASSEFNTLKNRHSIY
jgi:hypothetical protein